MEHNHSGVAIRLIVIILLLGCCTGSFAAIDSTFTNSATLFVDPNGNDAFDGASPVRSKKTITAAKNAAQTGYSIHVAPGTYNDNSLFKTNTILSYYFESGVTLIDAPGSNVTNNGVYSGWGIFDDRPTGATTNFVYGRPNIIYQTGTNGPDLQAAVDSGCSGSGQAVNSLGAVVITNPATRIYMELGNIQFGSVSAAPTAALWLNHGYTVVSVKEITDLFFPFGVEQANGMPITNTTLTCPGLPITAQTSGSAVAWGLGETHVYFTHIGVMQAYGIWTDAGADTNIWNGFFTGDLLESKVYNVGNNLNYVSWYNITEIRTSQNAASSACFDVFGGKAYLNAMKVWDTNQAGVFCFNIQNNGTATSPANAWINCQKAQAGGTAGGLGGFVHCNSSSSTAPIVMYLNCLFYEDSGNLTNGIMVNSTNFQLFATGGRMVMKNGVGVNLSAGTCHLNGMLIDTSAGSSTNKWPVLTASNGVYLANCTLVAPASTFSVFSPNSVNLVSLAGGFSTNSPVNAGVTIQGTTPSGGSFVK